MKIKAWLKYLFLISAILFIQYFLLSKIEMKKSSMIEKVPLVSGTTLLISITYISVGIFLGLDYFISMFKKKGKWKVNLPKVLFVGIPALYFCSGYILEFFNNEFRKLSFFSPVFKLNGYGETGETFIAIFQLVLGYTLITSLYKNNDEGRRGRVISWLRYLVYSLLMMIVQLITGEWLDIYALGEHLANLEMVVFYSSLGILLGTEYLASEAGKEGIWKINLPKVIFMVLPSLYFSLYSFILILNQNGQSFAAYPVQVLYYLPNIGHYFAPVFHFILGYAVISSLYKCKDKSPVKTPINDAVVRIKAVKKNLKGTIKRHPGKTVTAVICVILYFSVLFNLMFDKRIEDVSMVDFQDIEYLRVTYYRTWENSKWPSVEVRDQKKIKDFVDSLNKCVVQKDFFPLRKDREFKVVEFCSYSHTSFSISVVYDSDSIGISPLSGNGSMYKVIWGKVSCEGLD